MSFLSPTEGQKQSTRDLDRRSTREAAALLILDQRSAFDAAAAAADAIADAVDAIVPRIAAGGRLHYIGAGSSGRLGVLDASEMPPTFGTPPELVCAHIAGGDRALRNAIEGAEDDASAGAAEMRTHVGARDTVVGISASGNAPYAIGALRAARENGALTIAIVNNPAAAMLAEAERGIVLPTGAEAISGSTRLAAGTSQKLALNALSSTLMIRLGKVYDNLMVDVVATNEKLRERARRLLRSLTDLDDDGAQAMLRESGGSVKVATVMARRGVGASEARRLLDDNAGRLRELL